MKLFKDTKLWLMIFSLLCVIAIGVCVIVNVALENAFTWAVYPTIAVTLGWLIMLPFFLQKKGFLWGLVSITVMAVPFLFIIEKFSGGDWFMSLGLPVAIVGAVTLWISYAIIRFVKRSVWYKVAIIVLLVAWVDQIIDLIVCNFTRTEQSIVGIVATVFACVIAAFVFAIVGYARRDVRKK